MTGPTSFETFYYRKVGLGEGCGCAERIIDTRDFDRQAGPRRWPVMPARFSWRQFAAKYGLLSRPDAPD